MNRRGNRSDRALSEALKKSGGVPVYEGSLEQLAVRIDAAAAPLLSARRQGLRPIMWWEFLLTQ